MNLRKSIKSSNAKYSKSINWTKSINNFFQKQLLTFPMFSDRTHFQLIAHLLLAAELFINLFIVNFRKYTEIDWSTYMQQVECFLNGTLDYENIYGDTGPIVYPAGHLYVYTLLYFVTNRGTNIYIAQNIFVLFYLATLWIVFKIYSNHSKVPPYVLLFMCFTSHRIHSIYVLRLFNDPIAIFFAYLALSFFVKKKWTIGCIFYSFAVSVKMNILLFAPALFLLLVESHSRIFDVIRKLTLCALVQMIIGFPFLVSHPFSYIKCAFNLGRVFLHKWTVNYRFMSEQLFVHKYFHISLLFLHIAAILLFFSKRWLSIIGKVFTRKAFVTHLNGTNIALAMFTVNLIGIAFSRSLHYQFYVWYYHSLPFLLWNTNYNQLTNICIWGLVEYCWNVYPSTVWSSALLHVLHLLILIGLFVNKSTNGLALDKIQ